MSASGHAETAPCSLLHKMSAHRGEGGRGKGERGKGGRGAPASNLHMKVWAKTEAEEAGCSQGGPHAQLKIKDRQFDNKAKGGGGGGA